MSDLMLPDDPDETDIVGPADRDLVDAFYDLDLFQVAVAKTGFTVVEEMDLLKDILRDPDPRIRIQGLRHFRNLLKEIATISGRLATAKERRIQSNGTEFTIRELESGVHLKKKLSSDRGEAVFPITRRAPGEGDSSDRGVDANVANDGGSAGGSGSGHPQLDGHGSGGSRDDRRSDSPEDVDRGRGTERTVRTFSELVRDDKKRVQ